ncbi:MAG TPA: hypothetical protein VJX95_04145 [Oscillospiraceae bacterium]|nr:hypothetical protein [Oscillospiraceae bacterium]
MRIKRILASVLAAAIAVSATAISVSAADPDGSANYVFNDGKTGTAIEVQTVYAPLEGIKTAEVKYEFSTAEKDAFGLYNEITLGFAFVQSETGTNPDDITAYFMTTGDDVEIKGWTNASTWSAIKSQAFNGKAADRDITGVKFVIKGKSANLTTNEVAAAANSLVTLRETLAAAQSMIDNTKAEGDVSSAAVNVALTKVAAVADDLDAVLGLVTKTDEEAAINAFYDQLVTLEAGKPADYEAIAPLVDSKTVADVLADYLPAGYKFANVDSVGTPYATDVVPTTVLSALVDKGAAGVALLKADGTIVGDAAASLAAINAEIGEINTAEDQKVTDAQDAFDAVSFTKAEATAVKTAINTVLGEKAVKETLFNDIYKELAKNNVKGTFYMFGQLSPKAYVLSTPDFNKTTNITWGGWASTGVAGWLDKEASVTYEQILKPEEASNDFWVKNIVNKDGVLEWRGSLSDNTVRNLLDWGWYNAWEEAIVPSFYLVNELGGKLEIYNGAVAGANQGKTASEIAKFLGDGDAKSLELVLTNTDKNNAYNYSISVGEITYSAYPKGYVVPAVVTTTEATEATTEATEDTTTAATADDLDEAPNTGAAALVVAPVVISAIATIISKKRK